MPSHAALGESVSPSKRTAAYVAAIITMLAQVLCMYKTLTIVWQARSDERKKFCRLVASAAHGACGESHASAA